MVRKSLVWDSRKLNSTNRPLHDYQFKKRQAKWKQHHKYTYSFLMMKALFSYTLLTVHYKYPKNITPGPGYKKKKSQMLPKSIFLTSSLTEQLI